MEKTPGVVFAQLTDVHVGNNTLNGEAAKRNLRAALAELATLDPVPGCVLVTADLVCSGRRDELEAFCALVADTPLRLVPVPANHDLWGESDDSAWRELLGPTRQVVDLDGLRVVSFQDMERQPDGAWKSHLAPEQLAWIDEQLAAAGNRATVAAFHGPLLREGADYRDSWRHSNADEFLSVLARHRVLAAVTGHWHRSAAWTVEGVRMITTGALVGWQWTGIPPFYSFPTRPGYRLFHVHGRRLRTFWRDLGSQEMLHRDQVSLVHVGGVHTGGPRPQVRPVRVSASVRLHAQTWTGAEPITAVEWSCKGGDWHPLERTGSGPWADWTAQLEWDEVRSGAHVCVVRALRDNRPVAYDAVPLRLVEADSPAAATALPEPEQVFERFSADD